MKKKIIIIGGYGNGTVAQSTIEDMNLNTPQFEILGFLNDDQYQIVFSDTPGIIEPKYNILAI